MPVTGIVTRSSKERVPLKPSLAPSILEASTILHDRLNSRSEPNAIHRTRNLLYVRPVGIKSHLSRPNLHRTHFNSPHALKRPSHPPNASPAMHPLNRQPKSLLCHPAPPNR